MSKELGKWCFLIGVIIALVIGIGSAVAGWPTGLAMNWLVLILVVLGLVVGFANISAKESTPFLLAAIALLIANTAGLANLNTLIPKLGSVLAGIVSNLLIMVAPAALVVAVKGFYDMAKA